MTVPHCVQLGRHFTALWMLTVTVFRLPDPALR
jgi:hypothetical protein